MKISGHRKGISPIVATVLIIAATLIAFAAVLGYIFGIFGGAATVAKVQVTSASINHTCFNGGGGVCTFALTNTGTASTTATSATLSYGGVTNSIALTKAPITINANSTAITITVTDATLSPSPTGGQSYVLSVNLGNGESATYSGVFS